MSAVAVSMSARRFAQRRLDTVALMKSLGARQGFVIAVAITQLMLLGFAWIKLFLWGILSRKLKPRKQ